MHTHIQDPEQEFTKFLKNIEDITPKLLAAAKVSNCWHAEYGGAAERGRGRGRGNRITDVMCVCMFPAGLYESRRHATE